MSKSAGILSLLVAFNARWAFGVDIVVKIDKYATMTDDCDTAINNVEVIMFACKKGATLYKCFQISGHFSEKLHLEPIFSVQ